MSMLAIHPEESCARVAAIAGAEHTRLQGETVIAAPATVQEISAILRFAHDNGLAVVPTGAGTKLAWGNPVTPRIVLSLHRMAALREHSWQDMTCTVEAGCPWNTLEAALARHGQVVALDPLWPQRATVGGIAAANDSGALRLKYGSLRDLILGMTLVLPDGAIAKTGGKVVKNVAGYDLHKLMIGSFGTLAVIAEVNFRLHPIETNTRTWTAIAPQPNALEAPLRALFDSQIVPTSVQVRSRKQACSVDVRIAARPGCLEEFGPRLQSLFGDLELSESSSVVWDARQQLFDRSGAAILKISVLPGEIASMLARLQEWASFGGIELATVAQATGLITAAVTMAPEAALALIEPLREQVRAFGGSVVALQIPAEFRSRFDVWGCDSSALDLMREVKRRFDPHRILNPGRFVGEI
ncbi:MAG: FAD-binding oxidoreductase [Acidobacteriota bacterium]